MQRERGNRDERINPEDLIDGSRDFGSHRSMTSSIFGGRDPFDDPFFKRPFGSSFEPSIFDTRSSFDDMPHLSARNSKGLVIEELDSDDEGETHEGGSTSGKGPLIEHPDDEGIINIAIRWCLVLFSVRNHYFYFYKFQNLVYQFPLNRPWSSGRGCEDGCAGQLEP